MTGETDLSRLLGSMTPVLQPGRFVFATLPEDADMPASLRPVMSFRESEGITLILAEAEATQAGLPGIFPCRMITLDVHSSLDAVGFIALIARHLAAAGMGVNPVAGYYHDHLFIAVDRAEEAMQILAGLSAGSRGGQA
jgi:uncharacterized protein